MPPEIRWSPSPLDTGNQRGDNKRCRPIGRAGSMRIYSVVSGLRRVAYIAWIFFAPILELGYKKGDGTGQFKLHDLQEKAEDVLVSDDAGCHPRDGSGSLQVSQPRLHMRKKLTATYSGSSRSDCLRKRDGNEHLKPAPDSSLRKKPGVETNYETGSKTANATEIEIRNGNEASIKSANEGLTVISFNGQDEGTRCMSTRTKMGAES
ncbi:hypothetical protein EVAR_41373_1 [Eumeta japonica]|uniref:Uncharacterized protein n=1 Tax=Eumeta variegata TaxID=151549 RepID=A0A4C1X1J4_EUMVA|nr:hypothetical protein EVAR_41373_1 [Eumeta japonica]